MRELEALADQHREKEVANQRDQRLQDRLKERRLKRNPMIERIHKSRELIKLASAALEAGKFREAASHARLAIEYAQKDPNVAAEAEVLITRANLERASYLLKRIDQVIDQLDAQQLADMAEELVALAGESAPHLAAAARLLKAAGRPQRGIRIAQTAVGLDGKHVPAWEILFALGEKENNWHTALRAAEALVGLEPKNGKYKDMLKLAKRNV
jgi:hypothetical protein